MEDFFAWTLLDADLLVTRQWGDEVLVWNQASGDTHLLNAQATRVFNLLRRGPVAPSVLQSDLGHAPGAHPDGMPQDTLQDMVRLGLVAARPL